MTTKIRWLGHASIQVEADDQVIFFDPWVKGNPVCPIS